MHTTKIISTFCLSATLIACGGSGPNGYSETIVVPKVIDKGVAVDTSVASTLTFDLKAAYLKFIQAGTTRNFTITDTGGSSLVNGTGTLTSTGLEPAVFQGVTSLGKTFVTTSALKIASVATPFGGTRKDMYDSNYNYLGSTGDKFSVVSKSGGYTTAVKVNSSGELYTLKDYKNADASSYYGTTDVTYYTTADTASSIYLTVISISKNNVESVTFTSTTKYRVSAENTLTLLSDTSNATPSNTALLMKYN